MTKKNQLTPEQIAVLNLMVNGAFSSIAIHAIGDRVSRYSQGCGCNSVCNRQDRLCGGYCADLRHPGCQACVDQHHRPLPQEDVRNACLPLGLQRCKQCMGNDWQQEAHALWSWKQVHSQFVRT